MGESMQFLKIKQISNYPRQDLDAGAVIDWPEREALRMIASNLVERVIEPAPTPKPPTEKTTARKATETRG